MTAKKATSHKDMNGLKVTNLGAPTPASADAARISDVEAASTADRSRANHTGTQLASTISNFDSQVRTSRLDQMAAPTAPVSFNGQKITSQPRAILNAIPGLRLVELAESNWCCGSAGIYNITQPEHAAKPPRASQALANPRVLTSKA